MSNSFDRNLDEYSGVAQTLLKAAQATLEDQIDVALFGIPFDGGTLARTGSRYAPAQIRQMSHNIREMNLATRVAPFASARVGDIGDAPIDPWSGERSFDVITDFCKRVTASGALPLAVGGDHSIALHGLRGVASRHGPVGVIHFDSHCDTYDELGGSRYNHATPFRRAVEEGVEDPKRHIMIGLRGTVGCDLEPFEWAQAQGMTLLWMHECTELGPRGIIDRIRAVVGDGPTYLSLDVDGVDPADFPGTCSPEPGGLTIREVQTILRGLRGINLVGADLNEVSPRLDPTGYTAANAAHLIFELLCLLVESKARRPRE